VEGVEAFFYPEVVAVVGASGRPGSFSHEILRNLARGFRGRVYAVNPKYREIAGVPSYPSILDVPDHVDLAVVALRAPLVPGALEEAGRKGVKAAIVVAGGFAETGPEGARLQEELLRAARKHGVRVMGPNCIGVYNAVNGLDTFFLPPEKMRRPPKGYIGVVSQSGAFLTTIMDWIASEHVGIVKAANVGNKVDVDEAELIDYMAGLDEINTVMVYIEGVAPRRGPQLLEAVSRARDAGKTVVFVKGGKTREGARAARSHTASLAGDYATFKALVEEAGGVVVETPTEFVDAAKALATMGRLSRGGNRVLVVTNAGGPGVLAVDELERRGLCVPETPSDVVERLRRIVSPIAALGNPIDLTGDASDRDYERVLAEAAGGDWFDAMLVIALVQPATMTMAVADIIAGAAWSSRKPTVAVTIGADYGEATLDYMGSLGIPAYPLPDRAAAALAAVVAAGRPRCPRGRPGEPPARAREVIEAALAEGRSKLLEHEALALLEAYGVPVARYCLARSPGEAGECARRLAERLVLKVVSPDILHKSDVGGVIVGVAPEEAAAAYNRLLARVKRAAPHARIQGVLVQEMAPEGGLEAIAGARRDEYFGPIAVAGPGGVLVELVSSAAIAAAPVSKCRATQMIDSTPLGRLARGYRGTPPRDVEALAAAIQAISRIPAENPEVAEAEANPIMVYERGVVAVDARILLSPPRTPSSAP